MINRRTLLLLLITISFAASLSFAQQSRFKVLAFYSDSTEPDHIQFAKDAVKFLTDRAARLTERLLSFSRKQPIRPMQVQAGEVVRRVEKLESELASLRKMLRRLKAKHAPDADEAA